MDVVIPPHGLRQRRSRVRLGSSGVEPALLSAARHAWPVLKIISLKRSGAFGLSDATIEILWPIGSLFQRSWCALTGYRGPAGAGVRDQLLRRLTPYQDIVIVNAPGPTNTRAEREQAVMGTHDRAFATPLPTPGDTSPMRPAPVRRIFVGVVSAATMMIFSVVEHLG